MVSSCPCEASNLCLERFRLKTWVPRCFCKSLRGCLYGGEPALLVGLTLVRRLNWPSSRVNKNKFYKGFLQWGEISAKMILRRAGSLPYKQHLTVFGGHWLIFQLYLRNHLGYHLNQGFSSTIWLRMDKMFQWDKFLTCFNFGIRVRYLQV